MKKTLILASAFLLVFSSCKKDDDNNTNITPTQSNLVGTYKLTAATEDGVNVFNNSDESMNNFDPCERDDEYKLNADGTTNVVDAGTQCVPTSNASGTWSLPNSSTIVLEGFPLTIDSYNGTTLKVSNNMFGVTYRATYVKQ